MPRATNGYLEPSQAPGLGVEFDEADAAEHPYGEDMMICSRPAGGRRDR